MAAFEEYKTNQKETEARLIKENLDLKGQMHD